MPAYTEFDYPKSFVFIDSVQRKVQDVFAAKCSIKMGGFSIEGDMFKDTLNDICFIESEGLRDDGSREDYKLFCFSDTIDYRTVSHYLVEMDSFWIDKQEKDTLYCFHFYNAAKIYDYPGVYTNEILFIVSKERGITKFCHNCTGNVAYDSSRWVGVKKGISL